MRHELAPRNCADPPGVTMDDVSATEMSRHGDYQARMNAEYWATHAQYVSRLEAQNRKLRWTVVVLLVVGTLQWALSWI